LVTGSRKDRDQAKGNVNPRRPMLKRLSTIERIPTYREPRIAVASAWSEIMESSMRKFIVSTLLMVIFSGNAYAADQATLDHLVDITRQGCLVGKQFDFHADVNGNLTFRGAQGTTTVNVRQSTGATGISNELLRVGADQQTRDCMMPRIDRIISYVLGPRACDVTRATSFAREFNVERNSGWRGGGSGYSTNNWCAELTDMLRGQYPQGQFSVVGFHEDTKNTCEPFNCPQYLYHCTVHVKTDPVCPD